MCLHVIMCCKRMKSVGENYQQGIQDQAFSLEKCHFISFLFFLFLIQLQSIIVLLNYLHGMKVIRGEQRHRQQYAILDRSEQFDQIKKSRARSDFQESLNCPKKSNRSKSFQNYDVFTQCVHTKFRMMPMKNSYVSYRIGGTKNTLNKKDQPFLISSNDSGL